jgi:alkanesulfonate monooxygenase
MYSLDPGPDGEKVEALLTELQRLSGLGITHVHGWMPDMVSLRPLEILGEQVIPEAAKF